MRLGTARSRGDLLGLHLEIFRCVANRISLRLDHLVCRCELLGLRPLLRCGGACDRQLRGGFLALALARTPLGIHALWLASELPGDRIEDRARLGHLAGFLYRQRVLVMEHRRPIRARRVRGQLALVLRAALRDHGHRLRGLALRAQQDRQPEQSERRVFRFAERCILKLREHARRPIRITEEREALRALEQRDGLHRLLVGKFHRPIISVARGGQHLRAFRGRSHEYADALIAVTELEQGIGSLRCLLLRRGELFEQLRSLLRLLDEPRGLERVRGLRRQTANEAIRHEIRHARKIADAIGIRDGRESERRFRVVAEAVMRRRESLPGHVDVRKLGILPNDALVAVHRIDQRFVLLILARHLDRAEIGAFRAAKKHRGQQRAGRVSRFKFRSERIRLCVLAAEMQRRDLTLHGLLGTIGFFRDDQFVVRHRFLELLREHRRIGQIHQDAPAPRLRVSIGLREFRGFLRSAAKRIEGCVQRLLGLRRLGRIGPGDACACKPGECLIRKLRMLLQRIERRDGLGIFLELHHARAHAELRFRSER